MHGTRPQSRRDAATGKPLVSVGFGGRSKPDPILYSHTCGIRGLIDRGAAGRQIRPFEAHGSIAQLETGPGSLISASFPSILSTPAGTAEETFWAESHCELLPAFAVIVLTLDRVDDENGSDQARWGLGGFPRRDAANLSPNCQVRHGHQSALATQPERSPSGECGPASPKRP